MTKPMYCPMSFHTTMFQTEHPSMKQAVMECTPDCAWVVIDPIEKEYCCGIGLCSCSLSDADDLKLIINWRTLKDDAE